MNDDTNTDIDYIQEILDAVVKSAHKLVCIDGLDNTASKDIHPFHKIVLTEIIKTHLNRVYTGEPPTSGIDDDYDVLSDYI